MLGRIEILFVLIVRGHEARISVSSFAFRCPMC